MRWLHAATSGGCMRRLLGMVVWDGCMRRHLRGAMMPAIESDDSGMIMERLRRDCPLDCHGTREPPQIGYRDMIPCPCSHNQRLFAYRDRQSPDISAPHESPHAKNGLISRIFEDARNAGSKG